MLANLLRTRPQLFDIAKRMYRALPSRKDDTYRFFESFSKRHNGRVTFVQIGASDGLRWDPAREFIVRDGWEGVLVEPLPSIFELLKQNYSYLQNQGLIFVNAAISQKAGCLAFWTLKDEFLNRLSLDERVIYSQKSSFNRDHVLRWLNLNGHHDTVLEEITVPCMSLSDLLKNHWDGRPINLLIIDAEGHESSIIPSIDFGQVDVETIYFESINLGPKKLEVYDYLSANHYELEELAGDTVASRANRKTPRHLGQFDLT
jgi:FkbM family methyltransferase